MDYNEMFGQAKVKLKRFVDSIQINRQHLSTIIRQSIPAPKRRQPMIEQIPDLSHQMLGFEPSVPGNHFKFNKLWVAWDSNPGPIG
jgi:hypothetical protein